MDFLSAFFPSPPSPSPSLYPSILSIPLEPILFTYASLIVLAVLPIYFGSYASVEQDEEEPAEKLSKSDAYWFPVIGSGVLFTFYLLFNYFSKEYINYLLTVYFAGFGAISLCKIFTRMGKAVVPERLYTFDYYRILLERKRDGVVFDVKVTWLHAIMSLLSLAMTIYYVYSKNWIASNVFGEAFAMSAISLIQLDSFTTGMVLLSGLFFYDIFWVFGTDVMVTVAKSFDVPVKLLFPRDVFASPNANFSMLGLGDIVIPGVFIALCLKFDQHLAGKDGSVKVTTYRKPYFTTAIFFYILGLVVTMAVMHTFKAAQPALLYLSPAGILSVLLTALVRGELKQVFSFTTETVVPPVTNHQEQPAATEPSTGGKSRPKKD